MKTLTTTLILIGCLALSQIMAQAPQMPNSAQIELRLRKLNVLGSALYVAAHPDDENTRMITYLSNERLVNTAYLSMTRGDGGAEPYWTRNKRGPRDYQDSRTIGCKGP